MERYSVIENKRKREIVLLRGSGCAYKKCVFCDYHSDACSDARENLELAKAVLGHVTGRYGELEVINSGSVFELGKPILSLLRELCIEKNIRTLHFEAHYMYRGMIPWLRSYFEGIDLKLKLGLETFDYDFRENVMKKGIPESDPSEIAEGFDEANFLFGLTGQSVSGMKRDIELGLKYFDRICVNLMCPNSTPVKPDIKVIGEFKSAVYPLYKDNERVDILIENTDFGVGDLGVKG